MGNSDSHHTDHTPHPMAMEPQPMNYPDMNVIFKGIPKMMQVADDMHRMTNYIMDLRNMTIGLTLMTAVGIVLFLLLKTDSEQSSLSRPGNGERHSHKHLYWSRPGIDIEKLMEQSQQSSRQTPPHQKPYAVNNNGNGLGPASNMPECPLPATTSTQQHTPSVAGLLPVHQPNGGPAIKVGTTQA